jgi:tetratricopeptide (TPR) repeat protein
LNFFTAIFFLIFAGLSVASSLSAASAVKPIWKAQPNLLPTSSGPGIVICEPVVSPANPDVSNFGTGCALWLQVVVGGQPQFGKTPLWGELDRAHTELKQRDLQLSPAEALDLAPILGVTHVAVGTLRGAEPHLILTYRLLQVPLGSPIGTAITLTGTEAQITARLPQMAQTFVKKLGGVSPPDISASTGLTPSNLRMLGQVRWREDPETDKQRTTIEAMALHSPVAGMMNLLRRRGGHTQHFHSAVETLLAQAGDNTFVWSVITKRTNLSLLQHDAQLSALVTRYPHNSSLAMVTAFRWQLTQDPKPEIEAAEQAVKNAPHSPACWQTYSETLSDAAGDIRQGRVYDALSSTEAEYLGQLYAASEAAAHQAVRLDPADAAAWENLAEDATFNSNAALADQAMQRALALSKDKKDVYYWALQMYQPKWDGDPVKLERFARMAAADTTLHVDDVLKLVPELKSCGYPELAAKMLNDFTVRQQTAIALHPDDGQAHFELAVAQDAGGDKKDALTEYQKAATLLADDATVHYRYGSALYNTQNYDQAEIQVREALKIDPDFPEAHYLLSVVLQNQSSSIDSQGEKDAQSELQSTLALDPTYAKAYSSLAAIYQSQKKLVEAISSYQSAIRYGDIRLPDNYLNMLQVMDMAGQDEKVLAAGTEALKLYGDSRLGSYPDDANIYDFMGKAYLHEQKWDKAIAMCQAHLSHKADDPEAHEILAEADLGQGHLADAQREWRSVANYNGDNLFTTSQQKDRAEEFLKKYP